MWHLSHCVGGCPVLPGQDLLIVSWCRSPGPRGYKSCSFTLCCCYPASMTFICVPFLFWVDFSFEKFEVFHYNLSMFSGLVTPDVTITNGFDGSQMVPVLSQPRLNEKEKQFTLKRDKNDRMKLEWTSKFWDGSGEMLNSRFKKLY